VNLGTRRRMHSHPTPSTFPHLHCAVADPAAEHFNYPVSLDVRDLVTLDDVMEELKLGPNGYVAPLHHLQPRVPVQVACGRIAGHHKLNFALLTYV
jgi:hypothetical protein